MVIPVIDKTLSTVQSAYIDIRWEEIFMSIYRKGDL